METGSGHFICPYCSSHYRRCPASASGSSGSVSSLRTGCAECIPKLTLASYPDILSFPFQLQPPCPVSLPASPPNYIKEIIKYILSKRPGQRFLTADLLRAHEALNRDGDGAIHVLRGAVVGKAHLAEGLGNADDCFEVTDLVTTLAEGHKRGHRSCSWVPGSNGRRMRGGRKV